MSDKEQSSLLVRLLLPFLLKGHNAQVRTSSKPSPLGRLPLLQGRQDFASFPSQETEIDILATIQNLLRRCERPSAFLRPLSRLFAVVHNKLPRKALTAVFQVQQGAKT